MNKSSLIITLLIATLGACTNSARHYIDQNSVTEDGINLNFTEEPRSLIAGEEYKLDITHEEFGRKDLIITVNNGSISV